LTELELTDEIKSPAEIRKVISKEDIWTSGYLIDRLKQHLGRVIVGVNATKEISESEHKERIIFGDRKYYNQAFDLLRIGAFKPVPFFIINLSDLTERLRKELSDLDKQTRQYVLKQAVGRIFEDVDFDLFHNSISRVLKVKFEK
jgi:hypothetical protein